MLCKDRVFKMWPFEGAVDELLGSKSIVVAEAYPRAAYVAALLDSDGELRLHLH